MRLNEFEKRLREHANSVKDTMTTPFDIETEEITMIKKSNIKKTILLAAAIICLIGTTVFAAQHLLSLKDVATRAGYENLAKIFEKDGTKCDIPPQQSGDYTIQILGITSGKNLTNFIDVDESRSFIVGAISRTDGGKLTEYSGDIQMSPLVSGYEPWLVNIFTLNGGKSEFISDDNTVDYFVYECDTLEVFADRTVYISFYEGLAPSDEVFKYNTDGTIEFNESYTGVKALFDIPLDKSKANPEKAAEIVEQMWNGENEDEDEIDDDAAQDENSETETKYFIINPDLSVTTLESDDPNLDIKVFDENE